MKAVVFTLGCKVNEVESESIMSSLEGAGFEVGAELGYADVYVLNTCAVTREAEKKSRQLVARVKKFNPEAPVYVCGCASEKDGEQFKVKGVKYVCGARDKLKIAELICRDFSCEPSGRAFPKRTRTRAFIKVEDGCDNFCSYCVIPYLRGREVSRPKGEILAEIEATPAYEIVLTGINLSAYDKRGEGLAGLIRALAGVKKRIRLSSLECTVIDDDLLSALKNLYDFAPQFHLSLQSGSTAVLKSMGRRYTREQFLQKCQSICSVFPDAAITADIIAGFPTESEEDFKASLSIIDEAPLARVHAFAFSPREGTRAYELCDLSAEVKKRRLSELISRAKKAETRYISSYLGKELTFVAEEFSGGFTSGYSGNYIRIYVPKMLDGGLLYRVKPVRLYADGVYAELVNES